MRLSMLTSFHWTFCASLFSRFTFLSLSLCFKKLFFFHSHSIYTSEKIVLLLKSFCLAHLFPLYEHRYQYHFVKWKEPEQNLFLLSFSLSHKYQPISSRRKVHWEWNRRICVPFKWLPLFLHESLLFLPFIPLVIFLNFRNTLMNLPSFSFSFFLFSFFPSLKHSFSHTK